MRTFKNLFFFFAALVLGLSSCNKTQGEFDYLYNDLPFKMDKVERPSIPDYSVNLVDFGGIGDGVTLNTEAFKQAMEHLNAEGGGHLIVPEGLWLTGPIELLSNCDLHITPNAVVIFDPNRDLYPIVEVVFEGLDTRRCESPIHAVGAKNISITGGGVIDGSGESWRVVKREKLTPGQWKDLVASGGVVVNDRLWYPDEGYAKAASISNMNVAPSSLSEQEWQEIKSIPLPFSGFRIRSGS